MGIVGLGAIGLEVANIAVPFAFSGVRDPRRPPSPTGFGAAGAPSGVEAVWTPDRLDDLLAQSDVVRHRRAAHPGDQTTDRPKQIDRMKEGALLVNVARENW